VTARAAPEAQRATREANAARADLVVRALIEAGVERFFIAPGSRSTPLVASASRSRAACTLFLDERTAGFAAVGAARVGVRSAVITTSGTAAANLLPAMCEADVDELPWVAVTADRPIDMVGTGANQTLDQPPLLAGAARAVLDLAAPPSAAPVEPLRRALRHLEGPGRGPVHINVRFRKPLEPLEASNVDTARLPVVVPRAPDLSSAARAIARARRGVVVAGGLAADARRGAARLVEALGWPCVADITSGLPRGGRTLAPFALRSAAARAAMRPDLILWLGGRATDPVVETWAGSHPCEIIQVKTGRAARDPEGIMRRSWVGDPGALADALEGVSPSALAPTARALAASLPSPPETLNEPRVAREVLAALGDDEVCFLGNSMPVRDADRFGDVSRAHVICNRGASGIDGNVGAALGACLASGRPTTALLGDLTFLHDATALVACAQSRAPLRIVVVNNGGGGIFHFLPIAEHADVFPWFSTPHGVEAAPVASALGVRARRVTGLATLRATLARTQSGPEVIEVVTDRDENRALHAALDDELEARARIALETA
jgi:2-succinyl-5-enolpyruvyl-6-hydroxy-3-cyclohexene-1-carboxylate synthase